MPTKKAPIKKKVVKKPIAKKPIKKVKKVRYDVISPDGFSIHREGTFPSVAAAKKALALWAKRYESQGYYSSVRGRIALKDLPSYCRIVEVKS
jgi:hypothetical protein